MYCQSCGTELASELSYCNRCGAKLNMASAMVTQSRTKLVGATWAISAAMTLVTIGGFFMVIFCVLTIVTRRIPLSEPIVLLLFCFLLVVLGVDFLSRPPAVSDHYPEPSKRGNI